MMHVNELSVQRQRYLACSLLLLLVLIVSLGMLSFHTRYDEQLSALQYQQTIMLRKQRLYKQESDKPVQKTDGLYLQGTTAAIAAANLQRDVQTYIESNAGEIISVQALSDKHSRQNRPGISVRFKATHLGLRNVLHQLETSVPLLIVDNLQLAHHGQRHQKGELDIRLQISGFLPEAAL